MKYIAICPNGMEDISQKEIKEILKAKSTVLVHGRVCFETKSVEKLISKTQSIMKVYELKQTCVKHEEIETFFVESPFRVVCSRKDEYGLGSQEVEKIVGEKFFLQGNTVDLRNPKSIVFIDIVEGKIFVGLDLSPVLLSKREYRVKIHNQSINACVAYGLVRLSGYTGKRVFIDPFCRDGIIAIEAARFKKGKIFAYDALFPDVRSTEINATLAHVRKEINISRIEIEWLDTKFVEEEVDFIVSAVPFVSKTLKENEVKRLYKEFFYHVSFILKKKGTVVCIVPQAELLKSMCEGLKVVEEREISTSNLSYSVVVFRK